MRWPPLGDFVVSSRGRRVVVYPAAGAARAALRDYLLGVVASFALLERGVETLHASSVARRGYALAFVGTPGSGKSTLAAWFTRKGWKLLTDDLLAVRPRRQQIVVFPAPAEIKVAAAAARALGLPGLRRYLGKQLWRAPGARRPARLAAVYLVSLGSPRGRVRLHPLRGRAAFRALLGCAYNAAPTRSRLRRQFRVFTALARLPVRRLRIPRAWSRLEEARERIERDLAALAS